MALTKMFTRSDLENKKMDELKNLLSQYGLSVNGKASAKISLITSLITFPRLAIAQFAQKQGLKLPNFYMIQTITTVLNSMETPTPEQEALIKMSIQGKFLDGIEGQHQRRLFKTYKIYRHLKDAIDLLNE